MPICPKCSAEATAEDNFCGQCGHELQLATRTAPTMTEHALDVTEVKYRLGLVYYKKDNIQGAVKLWNEVLSIDPNHRGAKEMMAQAKSQQQTDREDV